jgi:hypothetical protein
VLSAPIYANIFNKELLPKYFFSDTWTYNNVGEIGKNVIVLCNNDQLCVPFARIPLAGKLPLISPPTIWENFPDENIKFIRNKAKFNEKLRLIYCSNYLISSIALA